MSQSTKKHSLNILLPTNSFGGHERMLLEWLKEAKRQSGLDIRIYGKNIPELCRECEKNNFSMEKKGYPEGIRKWTLLNDAHDLAKTLSILGKLSRNQIVLFGPGVIQSAYLHSFMASILGFKVINYVPMAYSSSDMNFRFAYIKDWVARIFLPHVGTWITITEQQHRLLKELWLIKKSIYIIPNRLELPEVKKIKAPKIITESQPIRILLLGRFERNQKGLDWLCEVLRKHRSTWVGRMQFVFQGKGEYEQELRLLADEMPNNAICIIPWGDATDELKKADVLLLPSRFEGFPLVAVEATHYDIPIVASNLAGLVDVLPPECIFPFGDFDSLINSLERIRDPFTRISIISFTKSRMHPMQSRNRFEQCVSNVTRAFADTIHTK